MRLLRSIMMGILCVFFRNIRPVIENFCKFIIYDLMGEEIAKELLAGKKHQM